MKLSQQQQVQEDEYTFPYHYLDLVEGFRLIEYQDYIRVVRKLLGDINNKKIMDAGCGDGRFCYQLLKENANITGVDYSQQAINFAKAFSPRGKFIVGDLTKLATKTLKNKFDAIVSIETIEHIKPDKVRDIILSFHKMLKKDGELIITVPSKNTPVSSKHYQHFFVEDLERYLQGLFQIERAYGHGRLDYWPNKLFKIKLSLAYLKEGLKFRNYKNKLLNFYKKRLGLCKYNQGKRVIIKARKI
tara:strand:- start:207 stop:941 length:735 start_codon:yes stop_codon:yes gene_type:complete